MEITFKVEITEGMIYDAYKGALNKCLSELKRQIGANDAQQRTGNLRTTSGFAIFRNGKPINDEGMAAYRDIPRTRAVKYSAVVTVGDVTAILGK